jgi:hypothetical protein
MQPEMSLMQGREAPGDRETDVSGAVLEAIRSIRYGSIEIVIHDGRVVAIERREKVRIDKSLER